MRAGVAAALVVLGSFEAYSGGIEPSMSVILCRWEATDILVLSPTPDRAAFQVMETIKGDAKPGDTIVLSELAPPDDVAAFREKAEREMTIPEPPPAMQPGDRMIAFLLRPGAQLEYFSPPEASNTDGWRSASGFGDMRFSAVWLRHGEAFAIFQAGNPGPTTFDDFGITEQEVRRQIDEGIQLRAALDRALTSPSAAPFSLANSSGRATSSHLAPRLNTWPPVGLRLRMFCVACCPIPNCWNCIREWCTLWLRLAPETRPVSNSERRDAVLEFGLRLTCAGMGARRSSFG